MAHITAEEALEKPQSIPRSSFGLHSGIGRLSHAAELLERGKIFRSYDLRARKGKGGTHQGRRKKQQEEAA